MTPHQRARLLAVVHLVAILLIPVMFFGIFAGLKVLNGTPEDIFSAAQQIGLITLIAFMLSWVIKPLRKYAVYAIWITIVAGIGSLTIGNFPSLVGGGMYLVMSLGLTWSIGNIYYKALVAALEARRRAEAQAEAQRLFEELLRRAHQQGARSAPPPSTTQLGAAYATLGVASAASDADVKLAYRRHAMKFHPDRNPGSKTAEAKMKEVTAAYELIKKHRDGSRA